MQLSEKTRRRALLAWIVVFTGLTFYGMDGNRTRAAEGQEAHESLCALHADLERRLVLGREFLADNPDGIPGITAATLRSSIKNQEATLDALSRLDCTTP